MGDLTVHVYGKDGCGLCEAAKDKLKLMGIPFEVRKIADYTTFHEGWRSDGSVGITACYHDINTLPVITVNGDPMSYPSAMSTFRRMSKPRMKPMVEAPVGETVPVSGDLVLA